MPIAYFNLNQEIEEWNSFEKLHDWSVSILFIAFVSTKGGPPSDHTPFLFFLAIITLWGIIKFFQTNREISGIIGGLLIMVVVSFIAAIVGAAIGIYEKTSITLVGVLIFAFWLFYPLRTKQKEICTEENNT